MAKETTPAAPRRRRTVTVPLWLAVVVPLVLAGCILWLWSLQRERGAHVRVREVDNFEEALPAIAGMTGGALLPGNGAEILQNGDELFPELLRDVAAARETIHVETYVWWRGDICRQVAEALAKRAREGVEVRLMLDALGGHKADKKLLTLMEKAGVKLRRYHALKLENIALLNNRTHRKLAVFDGRVGYVFGHGIAREWTGHGQDTEHWRDTGVRLTGPIVGSVQEAFAQNWVEETGEALVGPRYFPRLPATGSVRAHLVASAPHGGVSDQETLFKIAFATARRELLIQNPYFIPDLEAVELLGRAVRRGVDVRIMLPGPVTDSSIVKHSGHFYLAELLGQGVRIFEHQKTLIHQKVVLVDGLWSMVGSTNFDDRSFDINDEASVGLIDAGVAAQLKAAFRRDLKSCIEIRPGPWNDRGYFHKMIDSGAYAINGQL